MYTDRCCLPTFPTRTLLFPIRNNGLKSLDITTSLRRLEKSLSFSVRINQRTVLPYVLKVQERVGKKNRVRPRSNRSLFLFCPVPSTHYVECPCWKPCVSTHLFPPPVKTVTSVSDRSCGSFRSTYPTLRIVFVDYVSSMSLLMTLKIT